MTRRSSRRWRGLLGEWFASAWMMPADVSLDHCVIHISDWGKAVDFYTRVIGTEAVPAKGGGCVFGWVTSS